MCPEQAACEYQGYHAVSSGQLPMVAIGSPRQQTGVTGGLPRAGRAADRTQSTAEIHWLQVGHRPLGISGHAPIYVRTPSDQERLSRPPARREFWGGGDLAADAGLVADRLWDGLVAPSVPTGYGEFASIGTKDPSFGSHCRVARCAERRRSSRLRTPACRRDTRGFARPTSGQPRGHQSAAPLDRGRKR
jgi:hypothetical protein